MAVGLANLGVLAFGRGDLDGCTVARDGFAYSAETRRRQRRRGRIALPSRTAGERSSPRQAADYLQRAIAAVEAQSGRLGGADDARSGFTARYADYSRDYVRLLWDLDQPAQAFATLECSRARALLAMLAERDLNFAADLPGSLARERTALNADYDRVQATIARLNPASDSAEVERLLARLRELRDARESIAQTIRKASPRFACSGAWSKTIRTARSRTSGACLLRRPMGSVLSKRALR